MSIEFVCPNCGQLLRVPDTAAGKPARCPKCETVNTIPAEASGAPASPFSDAAPPSPTLSTPTPTGPDVNPYISPTADSYAAKPGPVEARPVQNQVVDAGAVINYALEIWKANLGLLVGAFVVATLVSTAVDFVTGFFQGMLEHGNVDDATAAILAMVILGGNLASFAVDIFFGIGQATIALKLARRQPAEFSDLFSAGRRFWPVLGASILAAIALVAGFILCIVPAIVLMLFYWPFYYLLVDEKATVFESFSLARTVTRGNVGTTFLLWLASVGIMILGLLACFIGIIFAGPLCSMIFAVGYLMMAGQIPASPSVPFDEQKPGAAPTMEQGNW